MKLLSLIGAQDGLVRHDQARDHGLSPQSILRRVRSGEWVVVHPRVYRSATHELTPRAAVRAAALWAGHGATVIGHGACLWWGLTDKNPVGTSVAVGPRGGHRPPPGVTTVRRAVAAADRDLVDGIWVVRPSFAALEAAIGLGLVEGARLLDRALQKGRFGVVALKAAVAEMGQRHGVVLARRFVELAAGGARSEAERITHAELDAAGITGWVPNLRVELPGYGRAELDIAFPLARIALEVDGWAFHSDVDRFRGDRWRQNEIVIGGWRVIRVTWYDLQENPGYIAEVMWRALTASISA